MMKKHLILMVTAAAALTVSEALSGAQEFNGAFAVGDAGNADADCAAGRSSGR